MKQTGYYRLSDSIALRSWPLIPHAYYKRSAIHAANLTDDEFHLLQLCDGEHALEQSELLDSLVRRGMVEPCEQGDAPSAWSRFRSYDNAYMPKVNFMITGKCNYNCLHCFNAADNAPLMSEWSFEDAADLIAQARDCGVRAWLLTGGEPMAHPRFMDIVREIYRNDMMVYELNTNGYYLTQEILDEMRGLGCMPTMKISFDGVGFHDWMRNRPGAEKRTLDAMRLCLENGFTVMAQTNLNRRNRSSMLPTLELLDAMDVQKTRIIRTTEAPRWEQEAGDACMTFEEYYGASLEIAQAYAQGEHAMELDIWQFMNLDAKNRGYWISPIKDCGPRGFRPTLSRCPANRSMIAISSRGEAVPCMQMSGYFEAHGLHLGNVHETPLADILTRGPYVNLSREYLFQFTAANEKCAACPHLKRCLGGCPALGLLFSPDVDGYDAEDVTKCLFFEHGWEEKIISAMGDWTNRSA